MTRAYDHGLDVLGAGAAPADIPVVRVSGSRWTSVAIFLGALASMATLWTTWRRRG